MTFFCNGCETDKDFFRDFSLFIITKESEVRRLCSACRTPRPLVLPDVYWDGKPEEGLADDLNTGKPKTFISKGQKAAYLKERGLQEGGDRIHGAPPNVAQRTVSRLDGRHEAAMALKKVREMGHDRRRQEFLKIMKERERIHAQF